MNEQIQKAIIGSVKDAKRETPSKVTFHQSMRHSSFIQQSPSKPPAVPNRPPSISKCSSTTQSSTASNRNLLLHSKFGTLAFNPHTTSPSPGKILQENVSHNKTAQLCPESNKNNSLESDKLNLENLINKANSSIVSNKTKQLYLQTFHNTGHLQNQINACNSSLSSTNNSFNKWKQFGLLMADAYDELKKKYKKLVVASTTEKQISEELKAQNQKLKTLILYKQKENEQNLNNTYQAQIKALQKELYTKNSEIDSYKVQLINNETIMKTLQAKLQSLKNSNASPSEGNKTEYYKQLYQKHLRQCSTLAEQLICLRSDLDRANGSMIKKNIEIDNSHSMKISPRIGKNEPDTNEHRIEEQPLTCSPMPCPYTLPHRVNK